MAELRNEFIWAAAEDRRRYGQLQLCKLTLYDRLSQQQLHGLLVKALLYRTTH